MQVVINLEIDRVAMRLKKTCPSIAKMVRAAKGNQRIALLKEKSKSTLLQMIWFLLVNYRQKPC